MDYWYPFIVFILGLCVGSFLNVLIYRLPRGIGYISGRSFCPKCKKKISWYDNIPLFSFLLLGGRCRKCKSPISWRYPVVEVVTGVLFVLLAFPRLSNLGDLGYLGIAKVGLDLLLVVGLIVVFFIDLEHQIIPDEIVFPLIFLWLAFLLVTSHFPGSTAGGLLLTSHFLSAIGAFLFFLLLYLVTGGKGMGLGDVKLAFLMGLVLGFPKIIVALYLAFLTGAFVGIILILVGKTKFGKKIALGPYLSAATILILLWGEKITQIVFGLIH